MIYTPIFDCSGHQLVMWCNCKTQPINSSAHWNFTNIHTNQHTTSTPNRTSKHTKCMLINLEWHVNLKSYKYVEKKKPWPCAVTPSHPYRHVIYLIHLQSSLRLLFTDNESTRRYTELDLKAYAVYLIALLPESRKGGQGFGDVSTRHSGVWHVAHHLWLWTTSVQGASQQDVCFYLSRVVREI